MRLKQIFSGSTETYVYSLLGPERHFPKWIPFIVEMDASDAKMECVCSAGSTEAVLWITQPLSPCISLSEDNDIMCSHTSTDRSGLRLPRSDPRSQCVLFLRVFRYRSGQSGPTSSLRPAPPPPAGEAVRSRAGPRWHRTGSRVSRGPSVSPGSQRSLITGRTQFPAIPAWKMTPLVQNHCATRLQLFCLASYVTSVTSKMG